MLNTYKIHDVLYIPRGMYDLHIPNRHKWGLYTLGMLFFLAYIPKVCKSTYIYVFQVYIYIGYVYSGYMYLGYAYFGYVWVGYTYLGYVYPWVYIIVSKTYVFEAWCLGTLVSHISFLYIYIYIYIYTHTYLHTYIYIHAHTYTTRTWLKRIDMILISIRT
jgi:hypothetical protein